MLLPFTKCIPKSNNQSNHVLKIEFLFYNIGHQNSKIKYAMHILPPHKVFNKSMIQTEAMLGLQKNKEKHTFQNCFIIQTIL